MLCKLIRAELMKLRRSPVWLAFIVMPVIPALMGTFNYLENLELLHSEWYSLWTQHTLFTDYIFLPLLIGIYCSYTISSRRTITGTVCSPRLCRKVRCLPQSLSASVF